ncbi:hypothetical protein [Glycomyces tritici]|uniref:Uncharacterized protein n=1 Tax=Glycomyces tritici TaxID=2665176 RepID=A0ABT7YLT3_9ACTN|nr:hypothetical protein [Glycomyces tritici]MDN3239579.1 hypothetical protein [Glycomyces tritici]
MAEDHGTLWEVVRDVVADVAPGELDYVEGLRHLDDRTVTRAMRRRRGRNEPLGFGSTDLVLLATPIVWIVVEHLVTRGTDTLIDRAAKGLRSRFGKRQADRRVPLQHDRRAARLRRKVEAEARRRGLSAEEADAIVDALFRRFELDDERTGPPER